MDSQKSQHFSQFQHLPNDTGHINASDPLNTQYIFNSSEIHPQTSMPQTNQFGSLNIPFQPNFAFNSMNASYPSHVHQQFGSGF